MKREVTFNPSYDKRSEGYGRHGVEIRFVVTGYKGAVQFVMFTNWPFRDMPDLFPMAADLGYHSPTPTYEGQELIQETCPYLDGKPCYYDGSGLNAEPVMQTLFHEGSDGVWKKLEDYYRETFGE